MERALDPLGEVAGSLRIGFEFYPHRGAGPSRGTLVATEGGPGYPARESRADYVTLFAPLLDSHDLLIMDNRGTGSSGAVDCPSLQRALAVMTVEAVAACGEHLGPHAWLYSTAYAMDDLAALLDALGIRTIDLYGDSYGTYAAQTFAVRHPERLHTLVLDGAYPLYGDEPGWYPSYAPAMRAKFNIACDRSPACHALPGTSIEHVLPAIERLRSTPVAIRTHDADGHLVEFTADAGSLATAMFGSAPALATVREIDAAARAYAQGDQTPLARLLGEARASVDSRDPTYDPRAFSAGLAAAVMCGDAPQIYDMTLPPAERLRERDLRIAERARLHPDAYAPFTYGEYRAMPLDYQFLDEPVLVLSGELDNMTTVADGAQAAGSFAHGRQVVLRNSFHVNALPRARSSCGARLVRRFVTDGTIDDDCSSTVPPVRLVTRFARRVADMELAPGEEPDDAARRRRQVAAATVATIGDVVLRAHDNSSGHGVGLRGGSYAIAPTPGASVIALHAVRWTDDLAVSGTVTLRAQGRHVVADVTVAGSYGTGHLRVSWNDEGVAPRAVVTGRLAGQTIHATCDAP